MTHHRELNEREQLILHAVVHTYITTAEAVGSRTIVKRFGMDLSPATVRNVMADLEEAGYLQQPHTSSGRVPTDLGYRYYVDCLMRVQELTLMEQTRIEEELSRRLDDADEVMRRTSHLLALVSHHTSIIDSPDEEEARVRRVELVPVSPTRVAVMVVDSYGRVRTFVALLDEGITPDELGRLNRYLNDHLEPVTFDRLADSIRQTLETHQDDRRHLAEQALRMLALLPPAPRGEVFLEGATQLFEQPEFRDPHKAREVFSLLEERERLGAVLRRLLTQGAPARTTVVIGAESRAVGLEDLSMVASPYHVGERPAGMVGILGPRRMPYPRLTALVDYTAATLSRFLTRLAG